MKREFILTDKDFQFIRKMIYDQAGISLADYKRDMVYRRLVKRLRYLQLNNFSDYCHYLEENFDKEIEIFRNALTTNLTAFFRENHHFEYLAHTVIPQLIKNKNSTDKKIRIWSAGCSTGEEPYSLAITLREHIEDFRGWDIKILATDIDSNVVKHSQEGIYSAERLSTMDNKLVKKYFLRGRKDQKKMYRTSPSLNELISFKVLNLLKPWPMKGKFDVIFCRNVVIYFDVETKKVLYENIANILHPDGHFFVGHSESLFNITDRFKSLGNTIYKIKTD